MINELTHIYLESQDLGGKSSLYKELWLNIQKTNNYKVCIFDRSYFSVLVYAIYYNRFTEEEIELIKANFLKLLNSGNIVFYINVSGDEIRKRYDIRGDELRSLKEILEIKEVYDKLSSQYVNHSNFYIINGNDNVENISQHILEIYTYKKEASNSINNVINTISQDLIYYGNHINGTYEFTNYSLSFSKQYTSLHTYNKNELNYIIPNNRFKKLEQSSYDYQFSKFNKKVESVISGYYGKIENYTSRKFVFTDDECLSFIHFLVRNDNIICNAHFRSSDVSLLKSDIISLYMMTADFCDIINKNNFKKVEYNLQFDSIHKYMEK